MSEQSHKREMTDALRGDFERLRARGVSTTLAASAENVLAQVAAAAGPELPPAAPSPVTAARADPPPAPSAAETELMRPRRKAFRLGLRRRA